MEPEDIVKVQIDSEIFALISQLEASKEGCRTFEDKSSTVILRKASLVRSINSSLAIEGNDLSPLSVMDIVNGKHVIGPFDEIIEVKNAIRAYNDIPKWDPWSVDDFLQAFDTLMFGLVEESGFRTCGVGVFEEESLIYRAPPQDMVPDMVARLFEWGSESKLPEPVVGAITHFYIESIHPFVDGNGRMGRLWNTKIAVDSDPIYSLIPMETYIRKRQDDYYSVLEECQSNCHDCTAFVKFCLNCSIDAFKDLSHLNDENMFRLTDAMGDDVLSLKDIMMRMGYSSRDKFLKNYINPALEFGIISRTELKGNSKYQMYRKMI